MPLRAGRSRRTLVRQASDAWIQPSWRKPSSMSVKYYMENSAKARRLYRVDVVPGLRKLRNSLNFGSLAPGLLWNSAAHGASR